MHKLISLARALIKTTQSIDHPPAHPLAKPDIAVRNPDNIPLCLSVRAAHIPDLRVRPKVVDRRMVQLEKRILVFNVNTPIDVREVGNQFSQSRKGRIAPRRHAKSNSEFVAGVFLTEDRGEAIVQVRLDAFDRANNSDMGGVRRGRRV